MVAIAVEGKASNRQTAHQAIPVQCAVCISILKKLAFWVKIPPLEIKDFHQQINQLSLSAENHNDNVVEILDAGRKIPKLCQSICQWLEQNQPWIP